MQEIAETLFDIVYLISVITVGILMIRGSKGNLQFHPVVLSKRKGTWRPGFSMDVADHCAELWILYPGSIVGRYNSRDWHADDSQDLCLCLDSVDWILCNETGM